MQRRSFTQLSLMAGMGLLVPIGACHDKNNKKSDSTSGFVPFEKLSAELLTTWCDAMLATQINDPENSELHGALYCDACNRIHGRCMDAVYPFLYMADATGEKKYLDAAINVMKWSDNVSKPDGSWTVVPNPKSWAGITVFGAIALGEALHHHGHVLPEEIRDTWTARLAKAAEFIHKNFTIAYSHINYAFTAIYGLNFLGRMFKNEAYIERSKELATAVPNWLTQPNKLIFGENKLKDVPSAKGLYPVDLGYNVEETLNGLVQYALLEKDEQLLQLLEQSMESHLEFMLPDGAWDNSWGTRQNKWSYWGSRTTDGCQPAFALMAHRNPAFGSAAYLSTELLKLCTVNGLLAGGLHYEAHHVLPCLHHSFAHAKSLAFVLDNEDQLPVIGKNAPLPRNKVYGIKHFSDLAVWLISKGPWRATVSANDVVFKKPYSQTATGGSLAVLWHEKIGPICTASMATYLMVEPYNQQPQPDNEDVALTPRIEVMHNDQWYTNLYDRKASVSTSDDDRASVLAVNTQLTNKEQEVFEGGKFSLEYSFGAETTKIVAMQMEANPLEKTAGLVVPVVSPDYEKIERISPNRIEIQKDNGKLIVTANTPITIMKTKKNRVFNMVPGMQAIPLKISFAEDTKMAECTVMVV